MRKKKENLAACNKSNILESAKKLFATKGLGQTTMDDIAREANYSKSTLYVYFRSKDDILNHLMAEGLGLFKEQVRELTARHEDRQGFLSALGRLALEIHNSQPVYFLGISGRVRNGGKVPKDDEVVEGVNAACREVNEIILSKVNSGKLNTTGITDAEMEALTVWWFSMCGFIEIASNTNGYAGGSDHRDTDSFLEYGFDKLANTFAFEK